jgi:16S rRNA processing protein RimM
METHISIGHTEKPHGINGELKLSINEAYLDVLGDIDLFFIKVKGKLTPYFLEELRSGNKLIAKFEDVDDRDTALALASQEILVRISDLPANEDGEVARSNLKYGLCAGYKLHDATLGEIGILEEVVEFPSQEMGILMRNNKEVLVPLHDLYVKNMDKKNKILHVDLPEGLLDL